MKKYLALLVLALTLLSISACHPNPANYTVPEGYQTCQSDYDCSAGYVCGFVGIDTYAVCKVDTNYHYHR